MTVRTVLRSRALPALSLALSLACRPAFPQAAPPDDSRSKAWGILSAGVRASNFDRRANAIQALGLDRGDSAAVELAEKALHDNEPTVRAAAAKALGAMDSTASIPELESLLSDKDISVVLAVAHALVKLKDNSGYDAYYSVLSGNRKGAKGLVAVPTKLLSEQLEQLKTPNRAIKFAFDQGIGFLPYAGYGAEAVRAWKASSNDPTRAAAARELANDPDPRSGLALVKAVDDKHWVVRAAALEAIAKRGDPALLPDIEPALSDKKDIVRFSAAAAVLHLDHVARKGTTRSGEQRIDTGAVAER